MIGIVEKNKKQAKNPSLKWKKLKNVRREKVQNIWEQIETKKNQKKNCWCSVWKETRVFVQCGINHRDNSKDYSIHNFEVSLNAQDENKQKLFTI